MRQIASIHARPFCFQQDGAPAHMRKATVSYLNEEGITFWGLTMWPPCSPDANPLYYAVCSFVQQKACQNHPSSLAAMKRQVSAAWRGIPSEKIRRFCGRFCSRLERIIEVKGGIMEK